MKTCPYCAEEIQDETIVCRYCGRELAPDAVAKTRQSLEPPAPNSLIAHYTGETRGDAAMADYRARQIAKEQGNQALPTEATAQSLEEPVKKKSVWPPSIGVGLVIAALAAIPRLVSLSEISEAINRGQLSELAFRGGLQDLAIHFATNWIIWSLVIAGSIALWRWNRWAVIVPLLLLVAFLLAGPGLSAWSDLLGISSLQFFQPPSFSAPTSAPAVVATGTFRDAFAVGAATYWAPVTLTFEACAASPSCRMVTTTPRNLFGPAATTVAATRAACDASPTCQMLPYYDAAATQTAQAGG